MLNSSTMKDKIRRVVVLMLENRGFDSVLGHLYRPGDEPTNHIPALDPGQPSFHGLAFLDPGTLKNRFTDRGKTYLDRPPQPPVRATNSPGENPHEDFKHVNVQLFGQENPPAGATPEMRGFLQDFSTHFSVTDTPSEATLQSIAQIMRMHTPVDLPVLNGLAKAYGVSDLWFSSVPTMTTANRAFALAGTSHGLVDNGFLSTYWPGTAIGDDSIDIDTIWNVLEKAGKHDWAFFWHEVFPPAPLSTVPYTRRIFPRIDRDIQNADAHFMPMERFFAMAEGGTLPAFSYLEPIWGWKIWKFPTKEGNDYHPPADMTAAEAFLKKVYLSLTQNKAAWEETLLIVMFDEHGGTYDHMPPPRATPPWGTDTPPFPLQYDFKFDRLGVRVPMILISPYIEEKTVFRSSTDVPFDHTSTIATLLTWMDVPRSAWKDLGARVAEAPTFEGVITRTSPRTDIALAPGPPPALGTVLEYGAPFFLRHANGEYIAPAELNGGYYLPTLSAGAKVPMKLRFGFGAVANGNVVQLMSDEALIGWSSFLGAWKDRERCYYYRTDDTANYGQQYWQITKVGGQAGEPLRYGDKVHIESHFADFRGQRLVKAGAYVSTKNGADDTWTIEPLDVSPSVDVVKFAEAFYLRHMGGEYVTSAEGTFPKTAYTGQVKLVLGGGVGDLSDGDVVKLQSTENALDNKNTLGAFGDSKDCYYWQDGYDKDKQGWKIIKVDRGDAKVHYGDMVRVVNQSYSGQKLTKDDYYKGFLTTSTTAQDWWVLEQPRQPVKGVIKFGDRLVLRNQNGRTVSTTDRSRYNFAKLANTGTVRLELRGGIGELTDGATVTLRSTEDALGGHDVLGAFADSRDCYYYTDGYDANKQSWKITKVGGGDPKVRYGDKVVITNLSYAQQLVADSSYEGYVTTKSGSTEWWILEGES